ncbi:hypothetical protein [Rhodopseudomonas palustris]|uniref:Uncharacterized protein n=1 Tax=Rhodopseudomonas palustris (strain DX-1) TaxID=652103 RepID=E6VH32_RHOPX|nr:hypothetical protein [Rhodopseudomonas palustris]
MIGFLRKRRKSAAPGRDKSSGRGGEADPAKPEQQPKLDQQKPPAAVEDDPYESGDICAPARDRDDYTKDL